MQATAIPFTTIDWASIPQTAHKGDNGMAYSQTIQYPGLRVRIVKYSAGYVADHWCSKGHIVHILEGELTTEQENGQAFLLQAGMTYIVSDEMSSHRSVTKQPVKLLIIDGAFLNPSAINI